MSRTIIGLAGFRQVGKTHITKHLCENHGFKSVHPFEVWKDGIKAMYMSIGIDEQTAEDMVRGDLKDTPHDALPDGADSRFLMERLGKYSGTQLGRQWTLGLALRKMDLEYPNANLIIESIVYEVDVVREFGGHVVMIDRPGTEGKGLDTDKATKLIEPDSRFLNDGSDLDVLMIEFEAHLNQEGLLRRSADLEMG
jgi:hypothetical protein